MSLWVVRVLGDDGPRQRSAPTFERDRTRRDVETAESFCITYCGHYAHNFKLYLNEGVSSSGPRNARISTSSDMYQCSEQDSEEWLGSDSEPEASESAYSEPGARRNLKHQLRVAAVRSRVDVLQEMQVTLTVHFV